MSEGVKADKGKLPWHLLPFDAVTDIVEVLRHGAEKYGDRNWEQGMAHSRIFSATMRHLVAFHNGEDLDRESGLPHLAHAATNLLFLSAYRIRGVGANDLAPRNDIRRCSTCAHMGKMRDEQPCTACVAIGGHARWELKPVETMPVVLTIHDEVIRYSQGEPELVETPVEARDCDSCEHVALHSAKEPCITCDWASGGPTKWAPKK